MNNKEAYIFISNQTETKVFQVSKTATVNITILIKEAAHWLLVC